MAQAAAEQAAHTERRGEPLIKRVTRVILGIYMRLYHRLELQHGERLPAHGPMLIVLNHASLLDVPALMVLDPYPDTATIVKASLFKVPGLAFLLGQWGAIPVERQGRDSTGVRQLLGVLKAGRPMAVAAEGRRTRTGRLAPINLVLARIAAAADVPIVPVGISGSFEALPPGAFFPRPRKLLVKVGHPFRLAKHTDGEAAAKRIRAELAALLPPEQQPLPGDETASSPQL